LSTLAFGQFVTRQARQIAKQFHTIGGRAAGSNLLISRALQLASTSQARGDVTPTAKRTDRMHDPEFSSQQARPKRTGLSRFMVAIIVFFLVLHAIAAVWLHQALTPPQVETSRPVTYGD
jgi:hypothetical protein